MDNPQEPSRPPFDLKEDFLLFPPGSEADEEDNGHAESTQQAALLPNFQRHETKRKAPHTASNTAWGGGESEQHLISRPQRGRIPKSRYRRERGKHFQGPPLLSFEDNMEQSRLPPSERALFSNSTQSRIPAADLSGLQRDSEAPHRDQPEPSMDGARAATRALFSAINMPPRARANAFSANHIPLCNYGAIIHPRLPSPVHLQPRREFGGFETNQRDAAGIKSTEMVHRQNAHFNGVIHSHSSGFEAIDSNRYKRARPDPDVTLGPTQQMLNLQITSKNDNEDGSESTQIPKENVNNRSAVMEMTGPGGFYDRHDAGLKSDSSEDYEMEDRQEAFPNRQILDQPLPRPRLTRSSRPAPNKENDVFNSPK